MKRNSLPDLFKPPRDLNFEQKCEQIHVLFKTKTNDYYLFSVFVLLSYNNDYAQTLIVVAFLVVNFFIEMIITRDHGVGQVPG